MFIVETNAFFRVSKKLRLKNLMFIVETNAFLRVSKKLRQRQTNLYCASSSPINEMKIFTSLCAV